MIYIYFALCLLMIALMLIFRSKSLVIFIISLITLFIYREFDLNYTALTLLDVVTSTVLSVRIFSIILSVILVYLISELFILLGFQNIFEAYFIKFSLENQKIVALITSSFGTNIDLNKSRLLHRFRKIYNQSITLVKTLNIFSVDMLLLFAVLLSINILLAQQIFFTIYITNFFVIYFFVKRIIDFKTDTYINYNYYSDRLKKLGTDTEIRDIYFPWTKALMIRMIIYIVISVVLFIFFNSFGYLEIMFLFLVVFIDFFISALVFSRKYSDIKEIDIYKALFQGLKNIINPITFIISSLIFVRIMSIVLQSNLIIYNFNFIELLIIIFILLLIASFILSDALVGLVLILPFFSIVLRNGYFDPSQVSFIYVLFGLAYFTNHISIINVNKKDYKLIADITYNFLIGMLCYVSYFFVGKLYFSYLILAIGLLIYYFIIRYSKRKKKL